MNKTTIEKFIVESNAIEGVFGTTALNTSLKAWAHLSKVKIITPKDVKKVHSILMAEDVSWSEPHLKKKYIGVFRDCPVYIGGRAAMDSMFIEGAIQSWCSGMNMRGTEGEENKVGLSKDLHVEYETIHPFVDGNGRTGRMFMNWERLKNGLPILIIHEGDEQYEYYKWFRK